MIVNAMSIDVEDYYHVENFKHTISATDWEQCESRVENNTYEVVETLNQFHMKATFFMLGWVSQKHKSNNNGK